MGLGLAFAAALFSTVSRDAGNLWATVILASTSLVLATLVGLVTVPYLARRVAVERLRESFDYDVTRAGIVYVVVTLVIGIAALNTGNNLLYIVVAAMLAAILVFGCVSALVLRYLGTRCPSARARLCRTAGCRAALCCAIRGGCAVVFDPRWFRRARRRKKASRSSGSGKRPRLRFPFNRPSEQQWLRLPDRRLRRVTRGSTSAGNLSGDGLLPVSASESRVVGRPGIEIRTARALSREHLRTGYALSFRVPHQDTACVIAERGAGLSAD